MNNTLKYAALAVFVGATGVAHADPAETKGGIKIKTEDGRFEATVGGRIQFDYYLFSEDKGNSIPGTSTPTGGAPTPVTIDGFGSALNQNRGGAQFRRAYLTLTGKAYGWEYKFENDFTTTSADAASFREMWIGTKLGPGKIIIGQHKPFRGMEELTSSNEITLMERPVTTASGIYQDRQFLKGLFYKGNTDTFGYGVHAATLGQGSTQTEGHSFGGRAYWFPFSEDGKTVHAALAYSTDREDLVSQNARSRATYGGRRGVDAVVAQHSSSVDGGIGSQATIHAELAGAYGSATVQAEYAQATFEDAFLLSGEREDAKVSAYYLQAGYFITGEKKVYKKDRGAFGAPKPNNSYGAVEIVARYEAMSNDDTSATTTAGCALPSVPTVTGGTQAARISKCDFSQVTLGANWYVNPNVRFMLNYYLAEADYGTGKDEPEAISLRAQFGF